MDFTLTAEQRELTFENARVPHANIVGEVNGNGRIRGAGALSSGDMFGDLELAANALGVCDSACEQALAYVKSHQQGGRPLIEQQLVQLKINRMHMLTEALRSFVLWVAWEHDAKIHSANAGLAMNYSSDVIQEVTEIGMDIFGAAGGRMHPGIDKLVRDGMIWTHLASDIVQRMRVVRRHIVKH